MLYKSGDVPGFVHISVGQEATAVGACWPLRPDDYIASTHRGHGHCLAKGMAMAPMFAELFGRESGACAGRGGSMHIADPAVGMLGANGIVGAGLPIAVGAAFASAAARRRRVRGVLRRRCSGDRCVPRGGQPRCALAAAGDLLLREQRLRRVLRDGDPASGADRAARRRATASPASSSTAPTSPAVAATMSRHRRGECAPVTARSSSRPTPTAGTVTTRATRSSTGRRTSSSATTSLDPINRTRGELATQGIEESTDPMPSRTPSRTRSKRRVAEAQASPEPDGSRLFDFVTTPRPAPVPASMPTGAASRATTGG